MNWWRWKICINCNFQIMFDVKDVEVAFAGIHNPAPWQVHLPSRLKDISHLVRQLGARCSRSMMEQEQTEEEGWKNPTVNNPSQARMTFSWAFKEMSLVRRPTRHLYSGSKSSHQLATWRDKYQLSEWVTSCHIVNELGGNQDVQVLIY